MSASHDLSHDLVTSATSRSAAAEVLEQIASCGAQIAVKDGVLSLRADHPLPDELVDAIRPHKPELLALLQVTESDVGLPDQSEVIRKACAGVIDPEVFRSNLTWEDLEDIKAGRVSVEYLRCAARSMAKRLGEAVTAVTAYKHQGQTSPDPELRRKVLKQLEDNPETKYAYVVDNPDTDPVIVGFGIRDVATCEIAIPRERFDPLEFLLAVKDMAGTT